jgi:hypothetical protein
MVRLEVAKREDSGQGEGDATGGNKDHEGARKSGRHTVRGTVLHAFIVPVTPWILVVTRLFYELVTFKPS